MEFGDGDQSDLERIKGEYDPAVRRILVRVEKRGDKIWRKEDSGDDGSNERPPGDLTPVINPTSPMPQHPPSPSWMELP
ncbi:hypothetical protein MHYP_G00226040 [Metynnis hypsauchen]